MNHMICKLGRGRKNPLDLRPFLLINRWVDCPRDIGLAFPLSLSSILIWKALSRQIYGLEGKRKVNQRDCVQEQDCCRRMKKCLECGVKIEHRITEVTDQSPVKVRETGEEEDERGLCNICLERRKDTAFLCGHQACSVCAEELPNNLCHICRKTIERKIPLYNS